MGLGARSLGEGLEGWGYGIGAFVELQFLGQDADGWAGSFVESGDNDRRSLLLSMPFSDCVLRGDRLRHRLCS